MAPRHVPMRCPLERPLLADVADLTARRFGHSLFDTRETQEMGDQRYRLLTQDGRQKRKEQLRTLLLVCVLSNGLVGLLYLLLRWLLALGER